VKALILIYYGDFSFYINSRGSAILINISDNVNIQGIRVFFPSEIEVTKSVNDIEIYTKREVGVFLRTSMKNILITTDKCVRADTDVIIYVNRRRDTCLVKPVNERLEPGEVYDLKNMIKVRKLHVMHVKSMFLDYMIEGKKTVEGRLYDEKRRKINVGDYIKLMDENGREAYFKVLNILQFSSFEEMIRNIGIEKVLPNVTSLEDAVAIYREFYSEEEEKKYGVCAIVLEPI